MRGTDSFLRGIQTGRGDQPTRRNSDGRQAQAQFLFESHPRFSSPAKKDEKMQPCKGMMLNQATENTSDRMHCISTALRPDRPSLYFASATTQRARRADRPDCILPRKPLIRLDQHASTAQYRTG